MKAVILAGGFGTRISEESHLRPKPMIEIGGRPILWHIMKMFSANGVNDFVICCGHKGYVIKEYFANYHLHMSDATFDTARNTIQIHHSYAEPWKVTVVDTGLETQTGGRLLRVRKYLENERFCFTYGDGVSDINIGNLVAFHEKEGRLATVTAVRLAGRFGAMEIDGSAVADFVEKPIGDGRWINGGFFILEPGVFTYLESDSDIWEQRPMRELTSAGQLSAFRHEGFWAAMDNLRDKNLLESLWASNKAPWKTWE
jgi:glucose-1-phosphate cytidylyltransferase